MTRERAVEPVVVARPEVRAEWQSEGVNLMAERPEVSCCEAVVLHCEAEVLHCAAVVWDREAQV
jgi:hypothetical protein